MQLTEARRRAVTARDSFDPFLFIIIIIISILSDSPRDSSRRLKRQKKACNTKQTAHYSSDCNVVVMTLSFHQRASSSVRKPDKGATQQEKWLTQRNIKIINQC